MGVMINPLLSRALSPELDLAGEGRQCRRASNVPSATLHRHFEEGGCGGRGQTVAWGSLKRNGVQGRGSATSDAGQTRGSEIATANVQGKERAKRGRGRAALRR